MQLESKLASKSNASLCYSMAYQRDIIAKSYFALMLKEAMSRDLNCKDIAQEILDFKKKHTGSDGAGPGSSHESSSPDHANEGINWVTGRSI